MSVDRLKILFLNHASTKSHMEDMKELFEMSYMGPLAETKQVEYESLWVGSCVGMRHLVEVNVTAFNKCVNYKPDVLFIYGWWRYSSDSLNVKYISPSVISLSVLYLIRKLLGIKIVALLFDQDSYSFEISDNLVRFCDFAFTHEHDSHFGYCSSFPERHIQTIATCSPKLFWGTPLNQRTVDIAFVGGLHGDRIEAVKELKEEDINVATPGGRGENQKRLSNKEYASIFHNAKIIINWSKHIRGSWYQAKGRLSETLLAGAMLLCEECLAVNKWLEPYVDYIPFWGTKELIKQAKYYLEHKQERLKIAIQGNKTAMAKYRADIVWGQMIDDMRNISFYNESDAIEGLIRNASLTELDLIYYFKKALQYPFFDKIITILKSGLAYNERMV